MKDGKPSIEIDKSVEKPMEKRPAQDPEAQNSEAIVRCRLPRLENGNRENGEKTPRNAPDAVTTDRGPGTAGRGEAPGDRRGSVDSSPWVRGGEMRPVVIPLMNAIKGMEAGSKVRESLALAYWPRVAGTQAATASQADFVRDGVLFVRTRSSTWSHELTFYKIRLMGSLNRLLGAKVITEIVFRAQGVQQAEPKAAPDAPSAEELAAVVLEPAEKTELRARLEALFSTIPEDRVRHAIAKRLTLDTKLRHWRLEHGWHLCTRCAVAHKTDFALCPLCRLCP